MDISAMVWLLLIFCLGVLIMAIGMVTLITKNQSQSYQASLQNLRETIQDLKETNQDLLNRVMSKDLQTYSTLTALHQSQSQSDPYVPTGDAAEYQRYADLVHGSGLGDTVTQTDLEELSSAFNELGVLGEFKAEE